jgi:hypothetical protein
LLISILLPVLSNARRSATDTQCASNIRQLVTALIMYAGENKGKFPPNIGSSGPDVNWWYDADRIGRYLPKTIKYSTGSIGGNVFICPRDEEAGRSYAMNYFASSAPIDSTYAKLAYATYWGSYNKPASQLMLILEKFSPFGAPGTYAAGNTIGLSGTVNSAASTAAGNWPGKRFVGNLSVATGGRFGTTPTEIDWSRHRRRGEGKTFAEADGRTTIGFAGGHVRMYRTGELADSVTGKSRFEALWSPYDREWQQTHVP